MMGAPETRAVLPRRFHLDRVTDESGVSGTGRVVEGVVFQDGTVALRWLTANRSTAIYANMGDVRAIHGHGGKTTIVYDDCARCHHPIEDHWMDNCGGCANAACQCDLMTHPEGLS